VSLVTDEIFEAVPGGSDSSLVRKDTAEANSAGYVTR
jgi:hypothetical protein